MSPVNSMFVCIKEKNIIGKSVLKMADNRSTPNTHTHTHTLSLTDTHTHSYKPAVGQPGFLAYNKMYNFDSYNVLLAIATNIPVLQGHISSLYNHVLSLWHEN